MKRERRRDPVNRQHAFAVSQRAKRLIDCSRIKEAISLLTQSIQGHPEDPVLYSQLAHCYLKLELYEKAESAARLSIKLEGSPIAFTFLAYVLLFQGKLEESERIAKKSIKFFNNNESYKVLIKILVEREKLVEAESIARDILEEFGDVSSYESMIDVFMAQNKLDEAYDLARKSLELFPGNYTFSGFVVEILKKQFRYQEAIDFAATIENPTRQILVCLAYCFHHLRKYKEAFEILAKAEQQSDSRVGRNDYRLMNCYMYLYDKIKADGGELSAAQIGKVLIASNWLKGRVDHCRRPTQESDFRSAMQIIRRHNL